jgi:hypothetical protein
MMIKILLTLVLMSVIAQAQEEAIRAASKALLEASHFRAVSTGEWNGEANDSTTEYVAPDRLRVESVALVDTVAIGSTTYRNNGSGWYVVDMESVEFDHLGMAVVHGGDVLSDIQTLPDEIIDGKACSVYSFTNTSFSDLVIYAKLWVDKATGLPLMYEGESEIADLLTETKTVRYDYDVVPEINAPIQQ